MYPSDVGKSLDLIVYFSLSPNDVAVNHSYNCIASLSTKNVTATIDEEDYGSPVTAAMSKMQIQAYNGIPNEPDFVASELWSVVLIADSIRMSPLDFN